MRRPELARGFIALAAKRGTPLKQKAIFGSRVARIGFKTHNSHRWNRTQIMRINCLQQGLRETRKSASNFKWTRAAKNAKPSSKRSTYGSGQISLASRSKASLPAILGNSRANSPPSPGHDAIRCYSKLTSVHPLPASLILHCARLEIELGLDKKLFRKGVNP